jgi:hypothetical protein
MNNTFAFKRSTIASVYGYIGIGIFLLFFLLNLKHHNMVEMFVFALFIGGTLIFTFLKQTVYINTQSKKIDINYFVFGLKVRSKSISIPQSGSVVFEDHVASQNSGGTGKGRTSWLYLSLSNDKSDNITTDNVFFYTKKHTAEDIESLKKINQVFSQKLNFQTVDKTTMSHWDLNR